MKMDKLFYFCLGLWAILTGADLVTNFEVVWMGPIIGISALVLGIICLVRAFGKKPTG